MNGKVQNGQEKYSWGGLREWICWPGIVLLLYILSSGPFWMMVDKKIIRYHTSRWRAGQILYGPLGNAYAATFIRKPLGIYWHL
jgi:hypothetical protein